MKTAKQEYRIRTISLLLNLIGLSLQTERF